ncbi:hypothetical protein V8J82_04865 [Gymnodinialimonas sp. 2305UL16-5]|uniref:hypothetical protein n=1 Tax=Gymnodinialimonas mytili TaxID=3126503 RepID=UPI0030B2B80A
MIWFGILRQEHLWPVPDYVGSAEAGLIFLSVLGNLLFAYSFPLGFFLCALPGHGWPAARWIALFALLPATFLGFFPIAFMDTDAAQLRQLLYLICVLAGLIFMGESLRFRAANYSILTMISLGAVLAIAGWSLVSYFSVNRSALSIAEGAPYRILIGDHETYEHPTHWRDLRGLDLGEDTRINAGGPLREMLTYHAVLLVEGRSGCWVWSKSRLRFEPEPDSDRTDIWWSVHCPT